MRFSKAFESAKAFRPHDRDSAGVAQREGDAFPNFTAKMPRFEVHLRVGNRVLRKKAGSTRIRT
jgi:hypothetical protein